MGNENLLPKNIRQIGEIQGRQKICLEDYVVTYIRKIESRGDENFLGIFLGERRSTEDADYVFVRGLMEVPDARERKDRKDRNSMADANERKDRDAVADTSERKSRKAAADGESASGQKTVSAEGSVKIRSGKGAETNREEIVQIRGENTSTKADGGRNAGDNGKRVDAENSAGGGGQSEASERDITKEKISLWEAFQRRYGTQEEGEESDPERSVEQSGSLYTQDALQEEKSAEPQDVWEYLQMEREERFPGCEVLGCCVIGAYPAGRVEELSSHVPEAGQMLYHLQDQEERLYWRDGDHFEGVKGYFVFYEQNRQMQAYLAETFGGASVEKENVPDDAIRSFREKVKSKAQERSRSFLKLASSFFVVGVLIIGVVMVNRVADLRQVQSVVETAGVTSATGETITGQSGTVSKASGEPDLESADAVEASVEHDGTGTAEALTSGSSATGLDSDGTEEDDANEADLNDAEEKGTDADGMDVSSTMKNSLETSDPDTILTGSDAFWADDESSDEDASAVSENTDDTDTAVNSGSVTVSDTAAASDLESSSDDRETTAGNSSGAAAESSSDSVSADTAVDSDSANDSDASAASDAAGTSSNTIAETTTVSDSGTASVTEAADGSTEASSRQVQAAYVIREGDTLAEICAKYYGSLDYLEELCEANEIEDANLIIPGQKIVLP